ncbi:replication initiation protein [Sulfitobacter sp. M22]|uniref:replication initiation protein n=1 Tax=Sulfitobacter sp. M22 TaxID=2675332 RepID=UPI001F32FAC2|nr:replication initiation protein [Sulfitobacter sp. M22]MCF7728681.1 RepB family plasmid replication initiator protein [Sulfitobacter sp. M22]
MSRQLVINLKPSDYKSMKPAELIKARAQRDLSLYERRSITILWNNAHKQGIEKDRLYTINMSELRGGKHNGNEFVKQAIKGLQTTLLSIYSHALDEEVVTQMLGPTVEKGVSRKDGVLSYRFPAELVDLLKDSISWGQIEIPVLMHLNSKYSISLYEYVSHRINLKYKHHEKFTLEEFRDIIAIESGKYEVFGSLNKHVIKKVVNEINALAYFNITVVPEKTGKRVTHVNLFWSTKTTDEKKAAYQELMRHSTGRGARISGQVEMIETEG